MFQRQSVAVKTHVGQLRAVLQPPAWEVIVRLPNFSVLLNLLVAVPKRLAVLNQAVLQLWGAVSTAIVVMGVAVEQPAIPTKTAK